MRRLTLLAPVLVAGGWLWAAAPADRPQVLPGSVVGDGPAAKPYGVDVPKDLRYSASTSCASAACHGNQQVGQAGGEQSTWAARNQPGDRQDPHYRAYGVLFNEDSVRMAKLLDRGAPAHQDALCLKCHAVDHDKYYDGQRIEVLKADGTVAPERAHAEGVGCDGCHGPSEKWVAEHYLDGFKALSPREKFERYGMVPTKNLVARTLACASCHVGGADREVNHDLIAAGHPRLSFESTRFHYWPKYGKHWQEKTPQRDFELRAWFIGQVVNLRAATDQLRARAERAADAAHKDNATTPWPEFTETSCYACHQNIVRGPEDGKPRAEQGGRTRPAGSTPWQVWYTGPADVLPRVQTKLVPGLTVETPDLTAVRTEMQKARPNPAKVAASAAAAVKKLDAWLAALQAAEDAGRFAPVTAETATEVAHLLAANVLVDGAALRDYDWDFVAQHYLGMAAAYHAAGGRQSAPPVGWGADIETLRGLLSFPPLDTLAAKKKAGPPEQADSPKNYNPADVVAPLKDIFTKTATTRASR